MFNNTGHGRFEESRAKSCSDISPGMEVSGRIVFTEQLEVKGTVRGTILSDTGILVVTETGEVGAIVEVRLCIVRGSVHGDITAREAVRISRTGTVNGDLTTSSLRIESGAVLNGVIKMSDQRDDRAVPEAFAQPESSSPSAIQNKEVLDESQPSCPT